MILTIIAIVLDCEPIKFQVEIKDNCTVHELLTEIVKDLCKKDTHILQLCEDFYPQHPHMILQRDHHRLDRLGRKVSSYSIHEGDELTLTVLNPNHS